MINCHVKHPFPIASFDSRAKYKITEGRWSFGRDGQVGSSPVESQK
jgi:hypothetical protein